MASISFDDGNSLFDFVVRDGNGVKGLVDSGLLVKIPERFIQPPHKRIDKQLNACSYDQQPPIDLSKLDGPDHDQVAEAIVRAAETLGFFQVVNHGMPLELLESVKDAAHRFFDQPPQNKAVYLKGSSPTPFVNYGTSFIPEKEKALDWRDCVSMVYSNDADALQYWPNQCKEVALEYLKSSMKMVRKIVEILIGNLGVTVDESRMEGLMGLKMVNMNLYPKCPNPELTIGAGCHSDIGTLTVLLQDGVGGLYVKVVEEENLDGAGKKEEYWMFVPPIPGALVINVGDVLQVLSNGRYKSAEHSVLTTSTQSRVSIPALAGPRATEKICPLPQLVERDGVAHYGEFIFEDYKNSFYGKPVEGKRSLDFAQINI